MDQIVELNVLQFAAVYLLLIIVLAVMKWFRIDQTKLLVIASMRMTVQLVLAGLILTYIFENPHPAFTIVYLIAMCGFAVHRILSRNKGINRKFKLSVAISISVTGVVLISFFIGIIVGVNVFNPQYTITIGGMVIGNAMTGVNLAMKTFGESIQLQKNKINTLLNLGVTPKVILLPFVRNALETALLPTLNSMLGMGIISLPGMMTGQILSGTMPLTAILYQIAIMVTVCTAVCLTVFCTLNFGYRTLYNKQNQIIYQKKEAGV